MPLTGGGGTSISQSKACATKILEQPLRYHRVCLLTSSTLFFFPDYLTGKFVNNLVGTYLLNMGCGGDFLSKPSRLDDPET